MHRTFSQMHFDSVKKLSEDQKAFAKEVDIYLAKEKAWNLKYDAYISSLSKGELQAQSEFIEAYKQNEAKYLLARRNLEKLLEESGDVNKLITYKGLCREGGELTKQKNMLMAKYQELE
jgi:hypothetical protein